MKDSRSLITKCHRNSGSCKNASLIAEGIQPIPEIQISCRYMLTHLSVHILQLSIKLCIPWFEDLCSPHSCICRVPGLTWYLLFCITLLLCAYIATLLAQWRLGEDAGGVLPHPPDRGYIPQTTTFVSPCFSKMEELGVVGGRSDGD